MELRQLIELLENLEISTLANSFPSSLGHPGKLLFLSNWIQPYSCKINLLAQTLSPRKTRDRWRNTKMYSDFHASDDSWNSSIQCSHMALYLPMAQAVKLYILNSTNYLTYKWPCWSSSFICLLPVTIFLLSSFIVLICEAH